MRVKDGRVKRNLLSGPKSAFAPTAASAAEARTGDPRRARSRGEGRGARAPAKARAACAMMLGRLCDAIKGAARAKWRWRRKRAPVFAGVVQTEKAVACCAGAAASRGRQTTSATSTRSVTTPLERR